MKYNSSKNEYNSSKLNISMYSVQLVNHNRSDLHRSLKGTAPISAF